MELCDLNLGHYISGERLPVNDGSVAQPPINLVFVRKDSSVVLKMQNIWTIMSHIANGLQFLHEQHFVHRDLKPRNGESCLRIRMLTAVLYSRQCNQWKIADFGISSQATSKHAVTTRSARGTGGYRAPELFKDLATFTNKVDIWALGCILFELTTGKKAFEDDWSARDYYVSTSGLQVSFPQVPKILQLHLLEIIHELLQRNQQQRPRVADLCPIFHSYCPFLHTLYDFQSFPSYSHWKQMVEESHDNRKLRTRLADWYKSKEIYVASISLLKELVSEYASDDDVRARLVEIYVSKGDWDIAISGWEELVDKHPLNEQFQKELANACKAKGDVHVTLAVWQTLAVKYPTVTTLGEQYAAALADMHSKSRDKRRLEATIATRKGLVEKHPDGWFLPFELMSSLNEYGDSDMEISVWKELVHNHPSVAEFHHRLRQALARTGDVDRSITVWTELVEKHPDKFWLKFYQSQAIAGRIDEIPSWREIVDMPWDPRLPQTGDKV